MNFLDKIKELDQREEEKYTQFISDKKKLEQELLVIKNEKTQIAQDFLNDAIKQLEQMGFVIKVSWNDDGRDDEIRIEYNTKATVVPSFSQHLKKNSRIIQEWPDWKKNILGVNS